MLSANQHGEIFFIYNIIIIEIVCIRSSNEISFIKTHISTINGLVIDPQNNQLSVGLIAQLVEQLTGIVEVGVLACEQALREAGGFNFCQTNGSNKITRMNGSPTVVRTTKYPFLHFEKAFWLESVCNICEIS